MSAFDTPDGAPTATQRGLVLVVSGSSADRRVIEIPLRGSGFGVVSATNGAEAVRLAAEARPDVVVCDVALADTDGYQVARQIRSDPANAGTRVILTTAAGVRRRVLDAARDAGAAGVIPKFATARDLLALIDQAWPSAPGSETPVRPEEDLRRGVADLSARLGRHERRLRSLIGTAGAAYIGVDSSGAISAWNGAAERLFGWPATHVIGRPIVETIIPPGARSHWGAAVKRAVTTGDVRGVADLTWFTGVHRDGRRLALETSECEVGGGRHRTLSWFIHDRGAKGTPVMARPFLVLS